MPSELNNCVHRAVITKVFLCGEKDVYREHLTVTAANVYLATTVFVPGSCDYHNSNHGITRNRHIFCKITIADVDDDASSSKLVAFKRL